MNELKNLIESNWDKILSKLISDYDLSDIFVKTWIEPLKIYNVQDNVISFYNEERGQTAADYLNKKEFDLFILSSIREVINNSEINVVIDGYDNLCSKYTKTSEDDSQTYMGAVLRSNLNPKYTFDNFIVGDNNKHAHATCVAVAECPGQDIFNPLFLYGNSGLGKTHLMQSIAHYILKKNVNAKVLYVPSETFTNEIIDAIKYNTTNAFREKYRKVDVLLIDDIQFIIGKDSTQNEFFNTFNTLYNDKKQIILSSDRPPKEIKTLDERIISRFECGVPIDIHEPDYETRMAILKNKAEFDNIIGISDEIFHYIAENITTNVRELEGALNKVNIYSKISDEPLSLSTVKNALKDIISEKNTVITFDTILNVTSEHFGVSKEMIISKSRTNEVAIARMAVMYLARKFLDISQQAIGDNLGGRDHATIINGIKRIDEYINEKPDFKNSIDSLINKIKPIS